MESTNEPAAGVETPTGSGGGEARPEAQAPGARTPPVTEGEARPSPPPTKRAVIPPAVLASRMQRYSIYLIVLAFIIVGANYQTLTLASILWFAAGLAASFALLCAIAVVILNAIAWNFDRMASELRGERKAVDLSEP